MAMLQAHQPVIPSPLPVDRLLLIAFSESIPKVPNMDNMPNAGLLPMPSMWEVILDQWWILALLVIAIVLAFPKKK
jgi:hypothetical protein